MATQAPAKETRSAESYLKLSRQRKVFVTSLASMAGIGAAGVAKDVITLAQPSISAALSALGIAVPTAAAMAIGAGAFLLIGGLLLVVGYYAYKDMIKELETQTHKLERNVLAAMAEMYAIDKQFENGKINAPTHDTAMEKITEELTGLGLNNPRVLYNKAKEKHAEYFQWYLSLNSKERKEFLSGKEPKEIQQMFAEEYQSAFAKYQEESTTLYFPEDGGLPSKLTEDELSSKKKQVDAIRDSMNKFDFLRKDRGEVCSSFRMYLAEKASFEVKPYVPSFGDKFRTFATSSVVGGSVSGLTLFLLSLVGVSAVVTLGASICALALGVGLAYSVMKLYEKYKARTEEMQTLSETMKEQNTQMSADRAAIERTFHQVPEKTVTDKPSHVVSEQKRQRKESTAPAPGAFVEEDALQPAASLAERQKSDPTTLTSVKALESLGKRADPAVYHEKAKVEVVTDKEKEEEKTLAPSSSLTPTDSAG